MEESKSEIIRNYMSVLSAPGRMVSAVKQYKTAVRYGELLRDAWLHNYSVLPGAVAIFEQIVTSREWMVLGKPRAASRAIRKLNNASFIDDMGIIHQGWEELIHRLCEDWLTVGRAMFHSQRTEDGEYQPLEYIDVAKCDPIKPRRKTSPSIWKYNDNWYGSREITQDQMWFIDNKRIGRSGGIVGTLAYLIPIANLDYLLREHDTMQLDGRKIRDIIITLPEMAEAIEQGMIISMALAAGEDPSKHGVPVVPVETHQDVALQDLIARLGLSELPRDFNRADLEARYAREISATLGLPIGQFWHDPRGTNRSLEQVQQERATLKGPSFFVRSLARKINNSPIMGTTPMSRAIIEFEEETDNSSLKLNAEALKLYAEGIEKINTVLLGEESGEQKNQAPVEDEEQAQRAKTDSAKKIMEPEQWLGFFQRKGLIPPNTILPDIIAMEENSLKRSVDESLEAGWVVMDRYERVLERRADFQIAMPRERKDETLLTA